MRQDSNIFRDGKTFFLDTEFNSFGGELISIALVPWQAEESPFYVELQIVKPYHQWVYENVVTQLRWPDHEQLQIAEARMRLKRYLSGVDYATFVADWPEDFSHLCNLLCAPEGHCVPFSHYSFELVDTPNLDEYFEGRARHNALTDALALRAWARDQNLFPEY